MTIEKNTESTRDKECFESESDRSRSRLQAEALGTLAEKRSSQFSLSKESGKIGDEKKISGEPTHLVLTDAFLKEAKSPDAGGHPQGSKWTVIVDLTLSLEDGGVKDGSDHQMAELEKLRERTVGTGVTVVVQKLQSEGTLDRWIIRDGVMTKISSDPSKGLVEDLKGLMKTAASEAPADHTALIIQSHGLGADGLSSDNSQGVRLDEIRKAIQKGFVDATGRPLDVLDFDSCLMGSQSVEDKMHGVADHIVASEEVMRGDSDKFDAQDLSTIVSGLLSDPNKSPAQFSDEIIWCILQSSMIF